ncbi:MAG: carbohydrate ABC transporter permease [Caldilineaceae bacterium SB0668_bin_21]|nr:carbohydrate ABC transporter permease [Caldilineaceae bacterium SB0668_bin_21]MYC20587.1 carbohydrate ABC transporter permease [Caldilineaceae bacterium SB0662_bin_25]
MFLPFLWLLSSSLKTELAIFRYPPEWIPDPIKFSNYVDAWTTRPFALYVRNTIVILLLNEVAVLVSASFCAYGFARIDFPGRNVWFAILLATVMLPGIVTMIPQFVIFSRIGWVNTILPLTVPFFFGGGAFNIFLLRQFFRTLPAELADAAYIDGASEITIYWRIMLPLAKPALATIAIFTFIGTWNDFMGPLLYLAKDPNKFTVALGLAMFRTAFAGRTRWDLLMAASTMMIIPVIFVFFVAQRYFIQGIAISGLKG